MDIEDDSMEIDEPVSATPIIERKSDEFSFTNNSLTDGKNSIEENVVCEALANPKVSEEHTISTLKDKPDVVVLDDDEEMPIKTIQEGILYFQNSIWYKHCIFSSRFS